MTISIIVAAASNGVIGKNNQLIWRLPADLSYFKRLTTGHHVIMGRKTFESIGKPLPNRIFVIVTRNKEFKAEGCTTVHSLTDAISSVQNDNEVFIIGGAEIYAQALPLAHKVYLTKVHHSFEGDAFFPELPANQWKEVQEEYHAPDEKNGYAYSFCVYEKV